MEHLNGDRAGFDTSYDEIKCLAEKVGKKLTYLRKVG